MLPVRVAWDPSLPVVASQAFTTGGRAFGDGDPFPWRELGISEQNAFAMWRSGLVSCVAQAEAQPAPTPTQKQQRSARR